MKPANCSLSSGRYFVPSSGSFCHRRHVSPVFQSLFLPNTFLSLPFVSTIISQCLFEWKEVYEIRKEIKLQSVFKFLFFFHSSIMCHIHFAISQSFSVNTYSYYTINNDLYTLPLLQIHHGTLSNSLLVKINWVFSHSVGVIYRNVWARYEWPFCKKKPHLIFKMLRWAHFRSTRKKVAHKQFLRYDIN